MNTVYVVVRTEHSQFYDEEPAITLMKAFYSESSAEAFAKQERDNAEQRNHKMVEFKVDTVQFCNYQDIYEKENR